MRRRRPARSSSDRLVRAQANATTPAQTPCAPNPAARQRDRCRRGHVSRAAHAPGTCAREVARANAPRQPYDLAPPSTASSAGERALGRHRDRHCVPATLPIATPAIRMRRPRSPADCLSPAFRAPPVANRALGTAPMNVSRTALHGPPPDPMVRRPDRKHPIWRATRSASTP
ncbi:protein of unknown function [Burkholderia multivorans]